MQNNKLVVFTFWIMLVGNIILCYSFLCAYNQGYYLNVAINNYSEAQFELALLGGVILLGLYVGYKYMNPTKFRWS